MTNYLCTHCNINWMSLADQDDETGNETYEFCPTCKNDLYLIENENDPAFIKCPITGRIYNPLTGEDYNPLKELDTLGPLNQFDTEAWQKEKEVKEQIVIDAIEAYQASGMEADYFEKLKDL